MHTHRNWYKSKQAPLNAPHRSCRFAKSKPSANSIYNVRKTKSNAPRRPLCSISKWMKIYDDQRKPLLESMNIYEHIYIYIYTYMRTNEHTWKYMKMCFIINIQESKITNTCCIRVESANPGKTKEPIRINKYLVRPSSLDNHQNRVYYVYVALWFTRLGLEIARIY